MLDYCDTPLNSPFHVTTIPSISPLLALGSSCVMIRKSLCVTLKGPEGRLQSTFRGTQNIKHVRQWTRTFLSGPAIIRYHGKILRDMDVLVNISPKQPMQLTYTMLADPDGLIECSIWYSNPTTNLSDVIHIKELPTELIRSVLTKRLPNKNHQHLSLLGGNTHYIPPHHTIAWTVQNYGRKLHLRTHRTLASYFSITLSTPLAD